MPDETKDNNQLGDYTQPSVTVTDNPVPVNNQPVVVKTKKPIMIVIIIATILAAIVAGSSLVYGLWYQNPEKVVTDALVNAATAKSSTYVGTMNINNADAKTVLGITAKQSGSSRSIDATFDETASGKTFSLGGSAIVNSSGDLFIKLEKLAAIYASFKDQLSMYVSSAQSASIDQIIAKVDGNWIKISSSDLKEYSQAAATAQTCTNDALNKFQNDKTGISEMTNLYAKNPFIVIDKKLGAKDGSIGYSLKSNTTALKAFAESLKTTKIYTTLHACDNSFTIDTSSIKTDQGATDNSALELWISSWSHQITAINFSDTSSDGTATSMTIKPTYNQTVNIVSPTSSITLTQLKSDIESLLQGL